MTDVILTLLLRERLAALHETLYRDLGFAGDAPRCHATPGVRVATLLVRDVRRTASGSTDLGGSDKPVSLAKVKGLFAAGSAGAIGRPGVSRFGSQLGRTHGGLLFSRSPTRLFHPASGRCRDLDLSSCYPSILRRMSVYVGKPVVFEPGSNAVTLAVQRWSRWHTYAAVSCGTWRPGCCASGGTG